MRELRPAVPDIGNDVDDRSTIRFHPSIEHFAHKNEAADQIAADHSLETLRGNGFHRGTILAAGIVDQAVNTAVSSKHRIDGSDDTRFLTNVANHAHDLTAVLLDLRFDLGELF